MKEAGFPGFFFICKFAVNSYLQYNRIHRRELLPVTKTKAITIRVDSATKDRAEKMLDDIGINMTTYIASSLKALVREKRVPFDMVTTQYLSDQTIVAKLIESEAEANAPDAKWLSHDDVFKPLREKYGYEV